MSATGDLCDAMPDGPARDELLGLIRVGLVFTSQHRGRRPGALREHVEHVVGHMAERTFDRLLIELEFDALRNQLQGQTPILRVDRAEETVIYLDEHGTERVVSFRHVRNIAKLRNS